MQLRFLTVTKRPAWLTVASGNLQQIDVSAVCHFWPAGGQRLALFLFEFHQLPNPEDLAAHAICTSGIGQYVYLNAPDSDGTIRQTLRMPPGAVARIGLRTWNTELPFLLEQVTISAPGAVLASPYSVADIAPLSRDELEPNPASAPLLTLNMMAHGDGCNAFCHAICRNWFDTMDELARRYQQDEDVGRVNCTLAIKDGPALPLTLFNGTPAMLRIPASQAAYLASVGDKARNMVRKAQRQGYAYRQVNPDDFLDDVLEIRTSNPERQGRPIPDYYKVRPAHMIDEPFRSGCAVHGERFFGVFKEGKLVAYSTIFFYGELGQVNHILGHAQHLQEGVMNLLMSEMVADIIDTMPWVRAINYLYPHSGRKNVGIGLFKRSIGFLPERIAVTYAGPDLRPFFPATAPAPAAEPAAPSERKAIRAHTGKAVREAVASGALITPPLAANRSEAVASVIQVLKERDAALDVMHCPADSVGTAAIAPDTAIVVEGLTLAQLQQFLATQMKGFRRTVPAGTYLLFDIKRAMHLAQQRPAGLLNRLRAAWGPASGAAIRQLAEYMTLRFKSLDLSIDDLRTGFKGSDYVVAGVADYQHSGRHDCLDSVLVLKKIR